MQQKKPSFLWVSHSSIGDYLKCPRLYYLRNVYRDPKTRNKVNIITPSLALGQIVHIVLESLSLLPVEKRFEKSLIDRYNELWTTISGKKGGFENEEEELEFKNRGAIMINRVMFHPGPLQNKALKLNSPDDLPPRYVFSEKDEIILCGKIDWLEYMPADDSVHIIDFKTGTNEEKEDSLQLPIYALLVKNCQKRNVSKISYWYLEKDNEPKEMPFPNLEESEKKILDIALTIKEKRAKNIFVCPKNGCYACRPFENILLGKAIFIGTNEYQDIYINPPKEELENYAEEDLIPF
ncbi:MAG TPA: PD-(D/E)XK nuclease family protein [Patescibacteria group bacterium]|nr:PD-(D/E)XK nuclease family protein [Patescibacteria group bacterium]